MITCMNYCNDVNSYKLLTLRESIEVLDGKKQKLDCIFEQ